MKNKEEMLQRLQALQDEKEANKIKKRLAELENELYEMDVDAMKYEVERGLRTRESAEAELGKRRKKYFG